MPTDDEIFGKKKMHQRNIFLRSPPPCPVSDRSRRPELTPRAPRMLQVAAGDAALGQLILEQGKQRLAQPPALLDDARHK